MEDYAILIILFLMAVCLLILTVIGYWGVFCKAGEKGWKVLIPFYNEYLLFKIAWKPSICLFKWLCLFLYEVVSVTLKAGVLLEMLQLISICTDSNALSPSKQSIWTWIWLYSRNHVFAFYLCAAFRSGEKQIYQTR